MAKNLLRITEQVLKKIDVSGFITHPLGEVSAFQYFTNNINDWYASDQSREGELMRDIRKKSSEGANAYILGSDKEKEFFNARFGMSPAHKSRQTIKYLTFCSEAYELVKKLQEEADKNKPKREYNWVTGKMELVA